MANDAQRGQLGAAVAGAQPGAERVSRRTPKPVSGIPETGFDQGVCDCTIPAPR
jgi:hypothetical protein